MRGNGNACEYTFQLRQKTLATSGGGAKARDRSKHRSMPSDSSSGLALRRVLPQTVRRPGNVRHTTDDSLFPRGVGLAARGRSETLESARKGDPARASS